MSTSLFYIYTLDPCEKRLLCVERRQNEDHMSEVVLPYAGFEGQGSYKEAEDVHAEEARE